MRPEGLFEEISDLGYPAVDYFAQHSGRSDGRVMGLEYTNGTSGISYLQETGLVLFEHSGRRRGCVFHQPGLDYFDLLVESGRAGLSCEELSFAEMVDLLFEMGVVEFGDELGGREGDEFDDALQQVAVSPDLSVFLYEFEQLVGETQQQQHYPIGAHSLCVRVYYLIIQT